MASRLSKDSSQLEAAIQASRYSISPGVGDYEVTKSLSYVQSRNP